jgi:hypothetical protein
VNHDFILGIAFIFLTVAGVILGAAIAIVIVKRDAKRRGTSGSLGAAMLEMQSLIEPERRHATKVVRAETIEDDAAGDPSVAGHE